MNKMKRIVLSLMSLLSLFVAIIPNLISTSQAMPDVLKNVVCKEDSGKTLVKFAETDYAAYLIRSKSVIGKSEEPDSNLFNKMLKIAGYDVGKTSTTAELNIFERFGFAGLSYSSYAGEWKYYDIDPCASEEAAKVTDLGEYYTGRLDPQSTFSELSASKDVRSKQYNKGFLGTLFTSMGQLVSNTTLFLSKFILALTLALLGLTFTDVSELVGLTGDLQNSVFLNLYNGFFVPLVTVTMVLSGLYLAWTGIVKRQVREGLINGVGKTLLCFFLAIVLVTNRNLMTVPNKVSTLIQTVVVSALGDSVSDTTSSQLCKTETGMKNLDMLSGDFLEKAGDRMKAVIGCRMYSEYIFKPWVKGQWGTDYENLDAKDLNNINSAWVGSPDVKLGTKTISNWALFQLSVQSGYHLPVDGQNTANIGGIHKDWYRIVDALSNYDEKIEYYGSNSSGGTSTATGDNTGGDWLTEGTESNKLAKKVYAYLTDELGLSGAAAVGVLANIEAESGWDIAAIETDPTTSGGAGFGLFQFTDSSPGQGNKSQYIAWMQANKKENNYKNQIDFLFEDEIWNRAAEGTFKFPNPEYGVTTSYPNIEGWLQESNPVEATIGFMVGYERPNESEGTNHLRSRRIPNAEKASKVFDVKKKADPSKWKFISGSISSGSSSSTGSSVTSSSGRITVHEIVDSDPLEQWNYWVGNRAGERFAQANLSLVLVIVGSIGPLVFGFLASTYSIALTLLMMVSPVFLLLGTWGGRGNGIMSSFFGSVLATMLKKVVASFLLVLSVILGSNTISLINSVGYFRAILFLVVITYVLIKNKDRLMDIVASINIGQLNLSAFNKGLDTLKTGAKTTAGMITSTAIGGATSKKHGGSFKDGARVGAGEYIKNKLYATETGRSMLTYMNAAGQKGRHGETRHCVNCGRPLNDGDLAYFDDYGNAWCEDCSIAEDNFDDMIQMTINNKENTRDMIKEIPVNEEEGTKSTKLPTYSDWNKRVHTDKYGEKTKYNQQAALDMAKGTLDVYSYNISALDLDNELIKKAPYGSLDEDKRQAKTLSNMALPDPIRHHLNAGKLNELLRDNKTDEFLEEISNAYVKFLEEDMSNSGVSYTDIEHVVNEFKAHSSEVNTLISEKRETYKTQEYKELEATKRQERPHEFIVD